MSIEGVDEEMMKQSRPKGDSWLRRRLIRC